MDFNIDNLRVKGVCCYRGDCYICNYTHRMIRNFQDPELPTNDKITDSTQWYYNFIVKLNMMADDDEGNRIAGNEIIPKIKVKEITEYTSTEPFSSGLASLYETAKVKSGEKGKIERGDLENDAARIKWDSTKLAAILPDDSKYDKKGSLGEAFGVPNTWYEHGAEFINRSDVNSVGLGHWITFRVLSNYNLCMRDIDIYNTKEQTVFNKPRSFYPLQKLSLSSEYKLPESNKINGAANVTLSKRYNFIMPDVPYIK